MIIKFWIIFLPIIICMNPDDIKVMEFWFREVQYPTDMVFYIGVF